MGNLDCSILVLRCRMVILAHGGEDGRREHFGSSLIGEWAVELNGAILVAVESCGDQVSIEFAEVDHARGVEGIVDVRLAGGWRTGPQRAMKLETGVRHVWERMPRKRHRG